MMHMTLYWGKNVTLLFDSCKTNSWTSYLLSLIACFIIATFYQYLENLRIRLKFFSGEGRTTPVPEIRTPLLGLNKVSRNKVVESVLFGVNSAIGYLLMLAIMSFNGGVFLAIVVGLTFGYFLFRSQGDEEAAVVVDNSCACAQFVCFLWLKFICCNDTCELVYKLYSLFLRFFCCMFYSVSSK